MREHSHNLVNGNARSADAGLAMANPWIDRDSVAHVLTMADIPVRLKYPLVGGLSGKVASGGRRTHNFGFMRRVFDNENAANESMRKPC